MTADAECKMTTCRGKSSDPYYPVHFSPAVSASARKSWQSDKLYGRYGVCLLVFPPPQRDVKLLSGCHSQLPHRISISNRRNRKELATPHWSCMEVGPSSSALRWRGRKVWIHRQTLCMVVDDVLSCMRLLLNSDER